VGQATHLEDSVALSNKIQIRLSALMFLWICPSHQMR